MNVSLPVDYCCQLTGTGRSAVATVLIVGPKAEETISRLFRPLQPRSHFPIDRIVVGHWQWNSMSEELVVCRTDCFHWEVHCHGGDFAIKNILSSLRAAGIETISWSDSLDAQIPDPLVAASFRLLSLALTKQVASILLDQCRGAMSRRLMEIDQTYRQGDLGLASKLVHETLGWSALGLHLVDPWVVTIAGPPNAGKSSLLNRLVGYERAIVFDHPGTTRDMVTAEIAIDDWPIRLIDTAGLRPTNDPVEAAGVQLAESQIEQSDLVIEVIDGDELDGAPHELPFARRPIETMHIIKVISKLDRIPVAVQRKFMQHPSEEPTIWISSQTGVGIPELMASISRTLVPHRPPPGTAIPICELARLRLLQYSTGDCVKTTA